MNPRNLHDGNLFDLPQPPFLPLNESSMNKLTNCRLFDVSLYVKMIISSKIRQLSKDDHSSPKQILHRVPLKKINLEDKIS